MDLCIVAIFKNEDHVLHEWIEHYLKEGVDKFFLVDNGSNDGYDIKEYIEKGIVEVWVNPKKHAQVELINHYLQKAKKYDWVLVVDLDEFMYARNGYKSIKEYLKTVKPSVEQIKVPWKMFGSSGHIKQPKSIIKGFTRRKMYSKKNELQHKLDFIEVKSIVRGKSLIRLNIHVHKINYSIETIPNDTGSTSYAFENVNEKLLKTSYLHLNHYGIQSWDFFKNVKMTRGAADSKKHNNVRTKKYFKIKDTNEKIDNELKNKR
jgi:hypothetical protein